MKDSIRAWLVEQFGEDDALHADLYAEYASTMKRQVTVLDEALARGDVSALASVGHAMKGMALQMGDSDLSAICLQLQNAGQEADLAACQTLMPDVRAFVAAL